MEIAASILQIYPQLNPNVDFRVVDEFGVQTIVEWHSTQPQPTTDQLNSAWIEVLKQRKIDGIRDSYFQTLASGFNITIGTNPFVFGWQSDDITHMNATQTAVGKGFLTFPILYTDINGLPVSIPDQSALDNIESTATKFMMNNHQQSLTLVGQIQSATTADAINAIQWTPATY